MAYTKLSALTAAGSFLAADELYVNEAGTSKKATGNQMATYVRSTIAIGQQFGPSNPTGTTSTTGVMMGLGTTCTYALSQGARCVIMISGTIFNATAIADGAKVQIRWNTGSAPANAAALTGNTLGGLVQFITATTAEKSPFALQGMAFVNSFSTIWIDVGLAAITGGTATITDLSVTVFELMS